MIKKTVRWVAVLAAGGVLWMGTANTTVNTTAGTTAITASTGTATGTPAPDMSWIREDPDQDRDKQCATTTAWGTGECPGKRLH
ncbi:hypothetical protein [Streptomyces sp. NBC_01006]|uniref:hypothetical protein n=1 Tax=Streptomyces sp. NBC_01006 TaxID=2903716 RepID=UPI002F918D7D|nr:hypothetical protein OG509_41920 [Streptomyces sp. NBC_01006]